MAVEINHDMDVKDMIRENLLLTKEIHEMTKKIKRHITFQKIMSFIWFIIIVVPIILSVVFLPPLIKNIIGPYQELLGPGGTSGLFKELLGGGLGLPEGQLQEVNQADLDMLKNIDTTKLPPEIQKLLK